MNLTKFSKELDNANPQDVEQFRKLLVEGMRLLSMADDTCARMIDVSRSSIIRWRNGTTTPHIVIRRLVFDKMQVHMNTIMSKE